MSNIGRALSIKDRLDLDVLKAAWFGGAHTSGRQISKAGMIGNIQMVNRSSQKSKKGMVAAITGTVLVALCCFTPILVILMAAAGLSAFTPYLDYILLPALGVMIIVTILSFLRWRKAV